MPKNKKPRKKKVAFKGAKRPSANNKKALEQFNAQIIALYQQGKVQEALTLSQQTLERFPDNLALLRNAGAFSLMLSNLELAKIYFFKTLEINPVDITTHNNLANLFEQQNCFYEAEKHYQKALEINPNYIDAHYNLGLLFQRQNNNNKAQLHYKKALELNPNYINAHNNLANLLKEQKQFGRAKKHYQRALKLNPNYVKAYKNLANLLQDQKHFDEAIKCYQKALKVRPDDISIQTSKFNLQLHMCDWSAFKEFDALSNTLEKQEKSILRPFVFLAFEDNPKHQKEYSERYRKKICENITMSSFNQTNKQTNKIRIGYFSADFYNHATIRLVSGLLREHDKNRFEVFAYSYGSIQDDVVCENIKADVALFVNVYAMSDNDIVNLVRKHQLDVAIDLKGYTEESRSELFAYRLAPIQINFLGYPGTMGADFIDYIIADHVIIPEDQQHFYTEKPIYLANSYQPNDNKRVIAQKKTTRADFSLPENSFVFCCFNQSYKIGPTEFDIWMRILKKVDNSVLWLLGSNQWSQDNLKKQAKARGVDSQRIVFANKLPVAEHLARHQHADLFIDTFNVNAHTTTSDALWAGLPVITKIGKQFAARVSASLLSAVGLPELITQTEKDYEALILQIANNPSQLSNIKQKLIDNLPSCALFDTKRYTRNFEQGLEIVHKRHIENQMPKVIDVKENVNSI